MVDCPDRRRWLLAVVVAAGLLALCPFAVAAESRDEWQQPDRVMDDLGLKPGDTVADVGCGSGYFTFRLATAVGEKGRVWAVDISVEALKEVRQRVEREKVTNVEIIQSEPTDTKLKAESVGAALLCDVIHEVPEDQRAGLMKSIAMALKPGGFLFFIDYRKSRDVTFDPYERLVPRDDLVKLATDAGLVLDAEFHYLKYQVFFRFRKAAVRSTEGAAAAAGQADEVAEPSPGTGTSIPPEALKAIEEAKRRAAEAAQLARGAQGHVGTMAYAGWPLSADEARRRQRETAQALGLLLEKELDLGGGVTVKLVLIPAGEFLMGSA